MLTCKIDEENNFEKCDVQQNIFGMSAFFCRGNGDGEL